MMKVVIMATGLFLMVNGGIIAHHKLNVPHPLGLCLQEQELSKYARQRIEATPLDEIAPRLIAENLATPDPRHDWCAPRYHLRKTIAPEVTPPEKPAVLPQYARLPPRRIYP